MIYQTYSPLQNLGIRSGSHYCGCLALGSDIFCAVVLEVWHLFYCCHLAPELITTINTHVYQGLSTLDQVFAHHVAPVAIVTYPRELTVGVLC